MSTPPSVPQRVLDSVPGSAAVDWQQHSNGGGWVYKTARVDATVYLHETSIVYGNARVYGNAWAYGNARIYGNARFYGNALAYGNARIYDDTRASSSWSN
jgi:hypothetical protein